MRRATENQGNTRTLTEYFQPRSKVKDLVLQQRSGPHFQYYLQETPMKPSQLPNRLSHPPARRMLPLQSPEPCHRDRLAPTWHPSHPQGPNYSSGFVPSGSSSGNRYYPMPTDRLGPLQHHHHHHQSPGSLCSSRIAPVSPIQSCTTAQRPPSAFHPADPQFMKDLNNHARSSSHIRREHGSESKVALSYSGNKHGTSQRQEANKAQSSDVRSSIRTIELQRPPLTASPLTRAAHDVCPPLSAPSSPGNSLSSYQSSPSTSQSSHRSSGSSLPVMHSPAAPCQELQHKQAPSRENLIPVVDLNCSSQKRRRDSEDCDESAKKLCLPAINSGKAPTPKPTAGTSQHNTSLLSQPSSRHSSSGIGMSPKTTDNHLCTEPTRGQSIPSSTSKPAQSSCASLSPNHYKTRPSMGAKQAFMDSSHSHVIELRSPTKKRSVDHVGSSPHVQLSRRHSEHSHHSNSVLPAKTASRGSHVEESRKSDSSAHKPASKTHSASSCRSVERNKTRPRKPVVIPDDITDLFTPDPTTFLVSHGHKTAKPTINGVKSPTLEQSSSSSTSDRKTASPHAAGDHTSSSSSAHQPKS